MSLGTWARSFRSAAETTRIPAYSANQPADETKEQRAIRRSQLSQLGPDDFLRADRSQPSSTGSTSEEEDKQRSRCEQSEAHDGVCSRMLESTKRSKQSLLRVTMFNPQWSVN